MCIPVLATECGHSIRGSASHRGLRGGQEVISCLLLCHGATGCQEGDNAVSKLLGGCLIGKVVDVETRVLLRLQTSGAEDATDERTVGTECEVGLLLLKLCFFGLETSLRAFS